MWINSITAVMMTETGAPDNINWWSRRWNALENNKLCVYVDTVVCACTMCVCVCVNGSILWPTILFYFPCKSAQSAGLSVDPPAWIVFSPDTHTLPQEPTSDCWILAIFHVNSDYQSFYFFFHIVFFCCCLFCPFILPPKTTVKIETRLLCCVCEAVSWF